MEVSSILVAIRMEYWTTWFRRFSCDFASQIFFSKISSFPSIGKRATKDALAKQPDIISFRHMHRQLKL